MQFLLSAELEMGLQPFCSVTSAVYASWFLPSESLQYPLLLAHSRSELTSALSRPIPCPQAASPGLLLIASPALSPELDPLHHWTAAVQQACCRLANA